MDLNQLRYFVLVARQGSISRAARLAGVSQPTLTVAIRRLERSLGTQLFHRGRDGVTLTSTGKELVTFAQDIVVQLERTAERIRGLTHDEIGHFVIGCHESLGGYFLPGFLSSFLKAAPGIEITLWNGTSRQVWEAVLAHEVHFGLVVNPPTHGDLVIRELFTDAVDAFVAAEKGARPDSTAEAKARLQAGPIVYAGRVSQCLEMIKLLTEIGPLSPRMITCGDLELVKSLALAGIGVALLPRRVAAYGHPGALRRLHPSLPSVPDRICLVFRGDAHRTHAMQRVKDAILAHGKAI